MYFLFIYLFSINIFLKSFPMNRNIFHSREKLFMCSPLNDPNNLLYRKYPLSKNFYELQLKRLNSKNIENNKQDTVRSESTGWRVSALQTRTLLDSNKP